MRSQNKDSATNWRKSDPDITPLSLARLLLLPGFHSSGLVGAGGDDTGGAVPSWETTTCRTNDLTWTARKS